MIIKCECCSRQLVTHNESTDVTVCKTGAKRTINGYICSECGRNMDENGNFPMEV